MEEGGRISLHCDCTKEDTIVKTAYGGESSSTNAVKRHGGAGTIYMNYTNMPNHVYIGNNGLQRNYRGFTTAMIGDNWGFVTPQTQDDGVGSEARTKTAGHVPDFSLDNGDTEASKLRRSFTSRIPTTLLFASEDASLDFGTFNQTTIHTLEIADGAHVVLTAPGLEEVPFPSQPSLCNKRAQAYW